MRSGLRCTPRPRDRRGHTAKTLPEWLRPGIFRAQTFCAVDRHSLEYTRHSKRAAITLTQRQSKRAAITLTQRHSKRAAITLTQRHSKRAALLDSPPQPSRVSFHQKRAALLD